MSSLLCVGGGVMDVLGRQLIWFVSLLQNMGIKDEFHQKSILVCIDHLQNGYHEGMCPGDKLASGVGGVECTTPASYHNLRNHSFHDLHRCDKCGLYLRGFIHQGQFCQGKAFGPDEGKPHRSRKTR